MDVRFEKQLFKAMHPRMRKHHAKPHGQAPTRPKTHVGAFLSELSDAVKQAEPAWPPKSQADLIYGPLEALVSPAAVANGLMVAGVQDGADAVKRILGSKQRKLALKRRRAYYATEAAVRKARRAAVEESRPKPAHPLPSVAELEEAYSRRREGDGWKLRFGTLMIDLEEHFRRTYEISGNKFVGSSGGVKAWLKRECPLLARHYATCLWYKRKAQDVLDPDTSTEVFD